MDLRSLVAGFRQHLAARAAASRTIVSYLRTVEAFLGVLDGEAASHGHLERFLAREGARGQLLAASTKRGELMALRAFFRFASREGEVSDVTSGIIVKRERRERPPAVVMPEEIGPLFEAASRSMDRLRNTSVCALLFVLGLRVHEVVALDVNQLDLAAATLRRVRGKGGTITDFPLPYELVAILGDWLRVRAMTTNGSMPLFPTARPSSSTTGRLSIRSMQRLVQQLARDAGLERAIGPHALRHACGTAAIRLGIDVGTTARVMRHANIATTSVYVHVAEDGRREPLARLASLIPRTVVPRANDEAAGTPQNHPGKQSRGGLDIQPLLDDQDGA